MSQRFCHHVNPAGVFCGCPPVNKRNYCFWHLHETGRRMKAARARSRSERVFIQLPVLDDLHAVQVGLMQLAEAIAHGEIDHHSGRLMLSVLRLAASNLKSHHGWYAKSDIHTFGVDSNIVIEDPGFEHQYALPKGFDLDVEPEAAFPPPAEAEFETPCKEKQKPPARNRRQPRDHHRRDQKRKNVASQPAPNPTSIPSPETVDLVSDPNRKPPASADIASTRPEAAAEAGN